VGTATPARWQCSPGGVCALSGRWRVNARARACAWVSTRVGCATQAQVWRRPKMGGADEFTAEPGSTPWAVASTAPAVGSRKSEWIHDGGRVRSGRPRTWCPFSFPIRDGARGSRPRRGRGGAERSNAAAASYARGKGPRLNLAPGIDSRACWGARWRGASGLRGDACERKRERERDRRGAASRTRVATHSGQR
jgi:hypothetical protein